MTTFFCTAFCPCCGAAWDSDRSPDQPRHGSWLSGRRAAILPAMADGAELEDLARRFLDLWQDQMSALAGDPEYTEALSRLLASMGVAGAEAPAACQGWPDALSGLLQAAGAPGPGDRGGDQGHGQKRGGAADLAKTSRGAAAGAQTAADEPGHGGSDLDLVLGRLAALEDRIAQLETRAGRARKGPDPKPRKGRP